MSSWESYGPPAMKIGPLEVWVHGRQFPDAEDGWGWLRVSARCSAHGATVLASGAFLDIVSFVRYAVELRELHLTLRGVAILASVEPNLKVTLEGQGPSGVLELTIEISPDHPNQSHSFRVEVDQSYIPQLLEECERVIALYAVQRGAARGLPNLKYPS